MSNQVKKTPVQGTAAGKAITDRLLTTFTGVDGKQHNVKWLCDQAVNMGKAETKFAENLFIVAKDMTAAKFDAWDKDVRAAMKWGKAPTKADTATKALYGATPRAWKNVVSIINQSFKHKVDLKQYPDVYGKEGINAELKARKDASGSHSTGVSTAKAVLEELYPEIQGHIMHVTAFNTAIKACPDAKAMLDAVMEELNDAVERCELILKEGIQTTGTIDIDAALKAEYAKQAKVGTHGTRADTLPSNAGTHAPSKVATK